MRVTEALEFFRTVTKTYFANATVVYSRQSRVAKPELGLVVITPGNLKRSYLPTYEQMAPKFIGCYESNIQLTIDLFTHGWPIEEEGVTVAYENTALEDMLEFENYLNSQYVTDLCHAQDTAIIIEGESQDLTGIVNDTNYEYRARIIVSLRFIQKAIGYAGVEGGRIPTSTGGGTEWLASQDGGYFEDVEIEEEENV